MFNCSYGDDWLYYWVFLNIDIPLSGSLDYILYEAIFVMVGMSFYIPIIMSCCPYNIIYLQN